jgi:farnesyl diphosphate synthase
MSDFPGMLAALAARVDAALVAEIGTAEIASERLRAAIAHAAVGGGKRLRPFLVISSAALFGVPEAAAMPAALALECVHCYSLVHDDLPAMDDDDLRRGRPTVHVAYDEATAILAGDTLLTLAFDILARPTTHADAGIRVAMIADLARASGGSGMVGGQMLDLAAEGRWTGGTPVSLALDDVLHLQRLKTGALFSCALSLGALLGSASPAERDALTAYATALGEAFQIADDLLDVEGDAATVGKATGKDAASGKGTVVALVGVDAARAHLTARVTRGIEALAPFGTRSEPLAAAIRFVAARER